MKWYVVHTYSGHENKAKLSLLDRVRQAGDIRTQRLNGRQLGFVAISVQQPGKYICSLERDRRNRRLEVSVLERENVLKLMRQFAQFAKAASRGISLEGMYGSPQAPSSLLVPRSFIELHGFIVKSLD